MYCNRFWVRRAFKVRPKVRWCSNVLQLINCFLFRYVGESCDDYHLVRFWGQFSDKDAKMNALYSTVRTTGTVSTVRTHIECDGRKPKDTISNIFSLNPIGKPSFSVFVSDWAHTKKGRVPLL